MALVKRADISELAIATAMEVHSVLGPGFKELTYSRAMAVEFDLRGIEYERELPVELTYKKKSLGEGKVDFLVMRSLVLELKATERPTGAFKPQVSQYLRALGLEVGLIINFNQSHLREGIRRVVRG